MIDKFTRLDEYEFLLMDEVGEVVEVEEGGGAPKLVIRMEDGTTVKCPSSVVCYWKVDVFSGRRTLGPVQSEVDRDASEPSVTDRRRPIAGTPITFAMSGKRVTKVLPWNPNLFDAAWPEVRVVEPVKHSAAAKTLWQGRDPRKMPKGLLWSQEASGKRRRREVCVSGQWSPYKG